MNKSFYSKRIRPVYKLYILWAILVPLAIAVTVLGWTEGDLAITVISGFVSLFLGIGFPVKAWRVAIRLEKDKAQHVAKKPDRKFIIILFRALWLLVFVWGIWHLAGILANNAPLYRVLVTVWIIIAGGGFFITRIGEGYYR